MVITKSEKQATLQNLTSVDWFNNAQAFGDGDGGKYINPRKAIECLNKAIKLKPDFAEAYYNRGIAYAVIGQHLRAIEDFNEAIRLKPDDADAHKNRACCLALQEKAAKICNFLRLEIERGCIDWRHIKEDKVFDAIKKTSCFVELLQEEEQVISMPRCATSL